MNRVIKFRGLTESGEWVYGYYYKDNSGSFIASEDGFLHNVIDTTVGQFTDKFDKDGKEIYDGDLCITYNIDEPSNLIDTVVFDDGSFVFLNDYKLSHELRSFKSEQINIIGNIHQNPELLNK